MTLNSTVLANGIDWGFPGCVSAPGDYDGDGTNDLSVYFEHYE